MIDMLKPMQKHEIYQIEVTLHAEPYKDFNSFEEALDEIKKLTTMSFDRKPLSPPCISGSDCTRIYEIHHYNTSEKPWLKIKTTSVVRIEKDKVEWLITI